MNLCKKLSNKITDKFDNLLIIGTGGWIVGKIINKNSNLPIFTMICKSYRNKKQGKIVISKVIPDQKLSGIILIVDDLIDSGNTLITIKKHLIENFRDITDIKIAVLIKKSKSKIIPDYYVLETDKWVVFPYESN